MVYNISFGGLFIFIIPSTNKYSSTHRWNNPTQPLKHNPTNLQPPFHGRDQREP